ncbi:hypothetical protein ACLBXJ_21980 [Methylobacterium mesophilicum]
MQDRSPALRRSTAAGRYVVTRIDEDEIRVDCSVDTAPRIDLTHGNLARVLALLEEREQLWNAAAACPDRPSDYGQWSMAALLYELPQGWEPAIKALDALPPTDSRVWMMPRAVKPFLEHIRDAWDLSTSVRERRARGERVEDGDVSAAVQGMWEAIELKWRLGHMTHCGTEFLMLADLVDPVDPIAMQRYVRLATECMLRLPTAYKWVEAEKRGGSARPPLDRTDLWKQFVESAFASWTADAIRAGPKSDEAVDQSRFAPEAAFLIHKGGGRSLPIGPFEPMWTSVPRTGTQQMMDASRVPARHASFIVWTFADGIWSSQMIRDDFERCLWLAKESAQRAERARIAFEPAAAAIRYAVLALEAFVNQLLHFVVLEGREAWPDPCLRRIHEDLASWLSVAGLTQKVKRAGNKIVGPNWLPPDLRRDLDRLAALRNRVTHLTVEVGKPLMATIGHSEIGFFGRAAQTWGASTPRLPPDRDVDAELAARTVECVEKVVATLRNAYAARYGIPPASENLDPPPSAPRPELIPFDDGRGGTILIPGFPLPAPNVM